MILNSFLHYPAVFTQVLTIFAQKQRSMKERESQFELLRILAMAMIVALHFNGVAVEKLLPITTRPFSEIWLAEVVEALSIVGVNVFVLISGYFGIRMSAKGVAKYVGQVMWYAVLPAIAAICIFPQLCENENFVSRTVHGLTNSTQWFILCYFILMAMSPAINAVAGRLSYRGQVWTAIALVIINCLFGWWYEMRFNDTGYTVYQLIMMYWIGGVIKSTLQRYKQIPWRSIAIGTYAISIVGVILMMHTMRYFKVIGYNNPVIMVESIALFIIFATMRFKSRAINWIASSAFAVYLVHMHFAIFGNILRPLLSNIFDQYGGGMYALYATGIGIAVYIISILIDKPRIWLFDKLLAIKGK